ncbi:MAG: gliding motility-associated peptidyl-prolyl isomerase GldI [Flavobacteriaceae bacterium]|nr:gliding motility-associated peptidyl-prolyl isomerase GldI [Flavobacteriaceae bacterium]|tara:strand:- start:31615 stop:32145 length:531 start_codon:yes stop_codon:yes gene_type:complete
MNRIVYFLLIVLLMSCSSSEPRRPINPRPSTTVFEQTVDQAKKIRALEEQNIEAFIQADSTNTYISSEQGFWYYYNKKIEADSNMPQVGDTIQFSYNIMSLRDSIIYDENTLGTQTYVVDKQDFLTGVQRGVKLMKVGETMTFIFPSSVAFGTAGDGDQIGVYQTIKSKITLLNIK